MAHVRAIALIFGLTRVIPYGRQSISEEDIAAVVAVLRSDYLTTGPEVERFETALAEHAGGTPAVAVSSGTAALHVAYAAAGIGPGDEVITPPLTFVATQATAMHLGATPVMVDVQEDTGNIDPDLVEAAITPRTKAIVAVDYAGHPADMDELRVIADRHGLLLIEDAAHSLGSTYRGRPVGALADITTMSFYPTKNITTGEGGAILTRLPDVLERARRFARQGLVREPSLFCLPNVGPWHQEVHEIGLNYRLPDVCAALGTSQLKRLGAFKQRRAEIKSRYDELFADAPGIQVPPQRAHVDPVWHLYPLRVPRTLRLKSFVALRDTGIGVQVNYLPANLHPALRDRVRVAGALNVAEDYYLRELSLPIHMNVGEAEISQVVEVVRSVLSIA